MVGAPSAFRKEVFRSITGSWGRFLAIAGIVALGCGFYAGLRMTAPDMRIAADDFYDGTHLYDVRLLSTLGFSDEQVDQIGETEGVSEVMASYSTDVMATLNDEQYAIRISSLPIESAAESESDGECKVTSSDDGYLNRLVLSKGSWPTGPGECVLSADRVMGTPIQIGDTVQVLYGSEDLDGVLDERTYTVVGLVHSSAYVSSVSLGTTSLGSGTIEQYMYVSPDNFSDDCPYTEVFVSVAGAADEFSGSDAYKARVNEVADRLTDESSDIAASRLAQVKADAQETLDTDMADFDTRKADAYAALDDAKAQLDDAKATIDETQSTLDSSAAQIASGQQQIDDARSQWQSGYATWEESSAAWATQKEGLESQLSDAKTQLAALETQLASLEPQLATLQAQEAGIQQQIDGLDPTDPTYAAQKAALENALAQVQAGEAQVQSGIDQVQDGITQANSGIAQLETGIQQGDAEVSAAKDQLDSAKSEIDANQTTLDESRVELESGYEQLAEGRATYEENLATYEDGLKEADDKFGDAASELADGQAEIDDIAMPDIYVLDRTKNFGVESFASDASRVDHIAALFPFIFFLVAALVALTTMTRMVDEERVLIGTHKALGYSTARITWKYLVYAGIASIAGSIIGILALSQVLPAVICKAYAIIYNVPQQPLPLTIDVPLALLSAGMGVGITLAATWIAAAATLREQPASLMLPRAPKAGKRILLERITPLWNKVSFSWKVTFRNLFRYRRRLWMTIIGIAGCTALLLTGLGLHDAIWDIITKQFDQTIHYNIIVGLYDDASQDDIEAAQAYLADSGDATLMARVQCENKQAGSTTHDSMGVQVVIPQDVQEFCELITIRNRTSGKAVEFDDNSVVLTEKLATSLGLEVGDTFTLYDQDEIGNATGSGYELTVTGIMENYVGNWAYIGKDVYATATGDDIAFSTIYANCTADTDAREALTDGLHDQGGVETVAFNDETIDSYRKMLSSVNMIVVVLVTAAAALAFIVLYNLTNINITERRREIASLKVLGFTPHEVDAYIYRETTILTLIGAALGLVLGIFLESFVVVSSEVDQVMFGRDIHATSFLLAFILTMVFAIIVMVTMRRKLSGVDMVESMKSVD